MKRKIKSLEMATVGKLLFVLVLVMSSVCAKGPLTNTLRPDEEVSVTLKVSTEHNGTTVKSLKVDLGTTRYALGQSISKNVTLGVTGLTSLSSIYASVFISKKGMSHGYGYEYGHADLTAVRTSPPSKRLLLKRPFPSPEDSQPPREVLQWFPAVDVYLSFDDAKRAVLPLGYLLLSNEYFPGGTVTSQRKLPMCCIDLGSNGTVQLRFTVNVHVSTPGEANAVLLKSNMAIGSSRMLPQSDSNDAQAILFNTSTYYLCALVILSVVHVVLTLLSIKNDVNCYSFFLSLSLFYTLTIIFFHTNDLIDLVLVEPERELCWDFCCKRGWVRIFLRCDDVEPGRLRGVFSSGALVCG